MCASSLIFLFSFCSNIAGFSHILTIDLHQKEVQGFFDCPIDNLRASNFLIEFITQSVSLIHVVTDYYIGRLNVMCGIQYVHACLKLLNTFIQCMLSCAYY